MKKSIILFIFSFISLQILAQLKSDNIDIGVFKNQYFNTDTISIFIKNKFEHKIFLQISLEKKVKNKWVEVLNDIFKHNEFAKSENIIVLASNEERIEKWVPLTVSKNKRKLLGYYRFSFKFSNKLLDLNDVIYSTKFFLK